MEEGDIEDMATINGTRAMDMEEDGVEEEEGGDNATLWKKIRSSVSPNIQDGIQIWGNRSDN